MNVKAFSAPAIRSSYRRAERALTCARLSALRAIDPDVNVYLAAGEIVGTLRAGDTSEETVDNLLSIVRKEFFFRFPK